MIYITEKIHICIAFVLFVSATAILSGCTAIERKSKTALSTPNTDNLGQAHIYTSELAEQLFATLLPDRQFRYAVAGFVPVDTLKQNEMEHGPLVQLGRQLEQGLMTEAVQRGFITQDFKVANGIIVSELSDRVLTRDLSQLSTIQRVDYFITGTITAEQSGATVNARVIDARTRDVIAAATHFFPRDIFWTSEQVTKRNGRIYRSAY